MLLIHMQERASLAGEIDWVVSVDSSIARVHQHDAPCPATQGAPSNYKKSGPEPADHAIGRSRGGLTTKIHLVCDGQARALAFVLTGGQVADTSMSSDVLDEIHVPGRGPARTRPVQVPHGGGVAT